MLTSAQVATAAYMTEDGELYCPDCFDQGDVYAKPIIAYSLDEEQQYAREGHEWPSETHEGYADDDAERDALERYHEECLPPLYGVCGHELAEEYHYHPEEA